MKFFLGVDGGQSGTTALIGDESGRLLGKGSAGPCNHAGATEGRAKLIRAVSESVGAACTEAGINPATATFEAACFGMSGGPDDKLALLRQIVKAEALVATHDAAIALAGATGGEPGIVIIAGTGSIAFGRNGAGTEARAGGWGYLFGDEGGAFDIARQALRAALRHAEGWGPPTALDRMWLEVTGAANVNGAMHHFYTEEWPRARVAALAPKVDEAAMDGDPLAVEILHQAAQKLALLTAAVRRQLWMPDEPVRVAWVGGAFRSQVLLARYRYLVEMEESNQTGPPQFGPAAGALLEAYRAAGLRVRLQGAIG